MKLTYEPRYCAEIREWIRLGGSPSGFAESLGLHRAAITRWRKKYEEFDRAVTSAKVIVQLEEKDSRIERMIELAKQGKLFAEICSDMGVSKSTLHFWAARDNEWADAVALAKTHAESWWIEHYTPKIGEKNQPSGAWIFVMKACFDWREQIEEIQRVTYEVSDECATEDEWEQTYSLETTAGATESTH